ncbi:energy coupling factor transporter S component ThiW [Zongyangia hominis]|uniref:Energy coupling factor transporter S component ThiW n=1 Tax=Zongyangia hominis TaxID=2763677 RepID=A0A926EBX8_9FIRM|nr:energy coupling factor transporter S component ThiW [Zongyangia hominis]MBC8571072.1 energy coupling factor transporter S component ThiW [Zongyangia hominis]
MKSNVKKLAFAGIFVALAVVCSAFYIPIGVSKCFPIQHMVNVLAGVFLGPWYACGMAFVTSLIRVLMGTGSLLAFPGSMIGALLCGLIYQKTRKMPLAVLGEVIGTGLLGALAAYPMATLFMAKEAAVFGFVLPFGISSLGGALISFVILLILERTKALSLLEKSLSTTR